MWKGEANVQHQSLRLNINIIHLHEQFSLSRERKGAGGGGEGRKGPSKLMRCALLCSEIRFYPFETVRKKVKNQYQC